VRKFSYAASARLLLALVGFAADLRGDGHLGTLFHFHQTRRSQFGP
jgi:hypothetical protein